MALKGVAELADVPAAGTTIVAGAPKLKSGTGGASRIFALL
jgi:kynurenine formamidase